MGDKRKAYRIFVGKPEARRPLRRLRRRWVDNIKTDFREIAWGGIDWIDLVHDSDQWRALVNTVMKLRLPYNSGKFLSSCTTGVFSRRAQLHEVGCNQCYFRCGNSIYVTTHRYTRIFNTEIR
jgi:hypothetical protein